MAFRYGETEHSAPTVSSSSARPSTAMPRLLRPPVFADVEQTLLARQLWSILLALCGIVPVLILCEQVLLPANSGRWITIAASMEGTSLALLVLVKLGRPRLAAGLTLTAFWAILTIQGWTGGGVRSPAVMAYLILVPIAGLLFGRLGILATGVACGASSLGFLVAEQAGLLPASEVYHTAVSVWVILVCMIASFVIVQQLAAAGTEYVRRELGEGQARRQAAEAALRTTEERLAAVFDAVREAVFIHDGATGRIIDVNRSACELYGYDRAGMLQLSPESGSAGVPPYSAGEALQWLQRARTEGPQLYEWQARHRTGRLFWVEINLRLARLQEQECFVATARDITERKGTTDALRATEQRLREIIEHSTNLFYLHTPDHVLRYVSPQSRTVFDCEPEEAMVRWTEFLSEHPGNAIGMERTQRALDTGQPQAPYELQLRTKKGRTIWVEVHEAPVVKKGKVVAVVGSLTDITEKKHAEEALAQERDLVARLVETSPAGIIVVQRTGQIVFANEQAERVLGLSRSAIAQRQYNDPEWHITDADGHPVTEEALPFRRVCDSGRPIADIQQAIAWPDGRRVLLSINAAPLFDAGGEVEAMVATVEDVTERVRTETALRESEERLRSITDHAPFGAHLYELRPDDRLVFCGANQSADVMLHLDHRTLIGREITEAFPGLAGTEIPPTYRSVVTTGQPYHVAQVNYDEGGIAGAFDVHAIPIGHRRLVVFFADITERQRAETALRLSEERYRMLFNAGNDGIFAHGFRPDGQPDCFTQVNDIACQMLGYSRAELLSRTPPDLNAPAAATHAQGIVRQLQSERHALFEMEIVAKDGRPIPVEINSRVVEVGGAPTVLSVVRDITARKRLEEQLRQSQKMEVFGQLAGGVAHDFNNLLVAIIGNAELLLGEAALSNRAREQIEQMHDAGRRAAALTRQLLLFSRKQKPQFVRTDLNVVVTNHVKLLRRIIGEDVNLTLEFTPSALPLQADVNMLEQVVMNLAVNARDAMPRGGVLTLTTRRIVLAAAAAAHCGCPPGTYAALLVRDTGEGISAELQQRIFEPFFTTKAAGKGTGLGLSTVLAIVQQHQGGITVASEGGHGAEFAIYFPLASETGGLATGARNDEAPRPARQTATILVVEDDDSVRVIIEHALRIYGYRPLCVRSAAEALARLTGEGPPIDAVLTDVVMPGGMSGGQLSEEIARRWPSLPVLLMSGYAKELDRTDARILQKPFTIAQLLATVQEALAPRRPAPPPAR